jgi:hypothetical protein
MFLRKEGTRGKAKRKRRSKRGGRKRKRGKRRWWEETSTRQGQSRAWNVSAASPQV